MGWGGLSGLVYLPYRAEMCHIVSVYDAAGGCHLALCIQILSLRQDSFQSSSGTRSWLIPFGWSDHLGSSCLLLAARHPRRQRPGALRSPPHADIYISDPTLLFGETQCYVVRVILFVHFWDMTNETSVLLCHRLDALQTGVQVGSGGNNCISLSSSFFSLSSQR